MHPLSNPRKLAAVLVAAAVGVTLLPYSAHAAWRGLKAFDCVSSRGNWNFDGLYGPYTQRSVRAYQHAHHVKEDGIAGPDTFNALGLKYRRTLKCGMGGNDVFLLQQTIAAAGFWYGGVQPVKPSAKPSMLPSKKPSPRPMPGFTAPPVMITPEPMMSAMPQPQPTPTPRVSKAPSTAPKPSPSELTETPENRATVELKGGNWMVPLNAGQTNYDYSFQRPTWTGGADLWLGNVGLGLDATVFSSTYTDFRPGQYFAQNTMMYDALLKYRMDHGYFQVFGGYRGIGLGDVNFGTLGVGMDYPIFGDWLWLQAKAAGGSNLGSSYFLDGQAGLGLRISLLELDLGFRHLAFQNNADPLFNLNGPVADVKLQF